MINNDTINNITVKALAIREVRIHLAEKLSREGWTLSKLKEAKSDELSEVGLTNREIKSIRKGQRPPIPDKVIFEILNKSKFVCCICQNQEVGIIIHHIEEWSKSRSHNIDNLVVLCPNHHDSAHTTKELTRTLDKDALKKAKEYWEKKVEQSRQNVLSGKYIGNTEGYEYDSNKDEYKIYYLPSTFFAHKIGLAFPGTRGYKIINNPREATTRLVNLLSPPIKFDEIVEGAYNFPISWFRGYSRMNIDSLKQIGPNHVLLKNRDSWGADEWFELNVKRIIVYSSRSHPEKKFVYCEFNPDKPEEKGSFQDINYYKTRKSDNWANQNFGLYYGETITFEEFNDGAFERNGKLTKLDGSQEFRYRYISPYNFIICNSDSVFIEESINMNCLKILDDINLGNSSFEEHFKYFKELIGDN